MNNYSFPRATGDFLLAEFKTKFKSRQSGQIRSDYYCRILINLICVIANLWNFFSDCLGRIAKNDYRLCHLCPSVRPSDLVWEISATSGRIFMKFWRIFSKVFLENSSFIKV
jgi:hypothetical protein